MAEEPTVDAMLVAIAPDDEAIEPVRPTLLFVSLDIESPWLDAQLERRALGEARVIRNNWIDVNAMRAVGSPFLRYLEQAGTLIAFTGKGRRRFSTAFAEPIHYRHVQRDLGAYRQALIDSEESLASGLSSPVFELDAVLSVIARTCCLGGYLDDPPEFLPNRAIRRIGQACGIDEAELTRLFSRRRDLDGLTEAGALEVPVSSSEVAQWIATARVVLDAVDGFVRAH